MKSSTEGLYELRDSLRLRGVANVEYNLSIVRGIDYYTAIVFEVADGTRPDLGSLCGGGRYDVLPRIFGRPELSATGAAGGVERIALSLRPQDDRAPSAYVAYTDATLANDAIRVLGLLRDAGIRSDMGQRGRKLSKQLEDASSRSFGHAVIVGRRELESGLLVLRDLNERREVRVAPKDLVTAVLEGAAAPAPGTSSPAS